MNKRQTIIIKINLYHPSDDTRWVFPSWVNNVLNMYFILHPSGFDHEKDMFEWAGINGFKLVSLNFNVKCNDSKESGFDDIAYFEKVL